MDVAIATQGEASTGSRVMDSQPGIQQVMETMAVEAGCARINT